MYVKKIHTGFWWENLKERYYFESLGIALRLVLLIWVLKTQMERHGLDESGSIQGQVTDSCEHCNEPLGSIKCGAVCDWLGI